MRYAKLVEGNLEFPGRVLKTDKGIVIGPDEKILRENGYLPIVDMETPVAPQGKMYYQSGWEQREDGIYPAFTLEDMPPEPEPVPEPDPVPPPPRHFDKYLLADMMDRKGLRERVMAMLDANGLRWRWDDSTLFREDDPYFVRAVEAAKAEFGLTDAEVGEVLSACVSRVVLAPK